MSIGQRIPGGSATVELSRATQGSIAYTDLDARGIVWAEPEGLRELTPSGATPRSRRDGERVRTLRFICDNDPTNLPILWDAHGQVVSFRYRSEGAGTGNEQIVGQGVAESTPNYPTVGPSTYAVTVHVNGVPTTSTQ